MLAQLQNVPAVSFVGLSVVAVAKLADERAGLMLVLAAAAAHPNSDQLRAHPEPLVILEPRYALG